MERLQAGSPHAAYSESTDGNADPFNQVWRLSSLGHDAQYFQAGAFVMHVPTGLFAYGAYGNMQNDTESAYTAVETTWYGKVGLRSRFSALGHTVFYGEYLNC